eukprot:9515362-Alexandrium_andersonii.AAC.1
MRCCPSAVVPLLLSFWVRPTHPAAVSSACSQASGAARRGLDRVEEHGVGLFAWPSRSGVE